MGGRADLVIQDIPASVAGPVTRETNPARVDSVVSRVVVDSLDLVVRREQPQLRAIQATRDSAAQLVLEHPDSVVTRELADTPAFLVQVAILVIQALAATQAIAVSLGLPVTVVIQELER